MLECSHRPPCPGCPRLGEGGIAPSAYSQLAALARESALPPPPVIEGDALAWRRRSRLAVRGRVHSPKIGLFAPGSHDVIDIPQCGVHHPAINRTVAAVKRALRETATACYQEDRHSGLVRYLQCVVERGSDRVQLVAVCNASSAKTFIRAALRIQELLGDELHSLWWNGNTGRTNTILGVQWKHLAGETAVRENIGGVEVHFPPGALGQENLDLADRIVCIGPAAAQASYLNSDALIMAAKGTGCDALHPGYGFLAENAGLAGACGENDILFVGPRPETIEQLGDKLAARRVAAAPSASPWDDELGRMEELDSFVNGLTFKLKIVYLDI